MLWTRLTETGESLPRSFLLGCRDTADVAARRSDQAAGSAADRERAAKWWAENRPAAPGAISHDLQAALEALVEQPGIGTRIEISRPDEVRRLFLARVGYFVYYRTKGRFLEVIAFWHASREASDPVVAPGDRQGVKGESP